METVPVERVKLGTETVTDERTVTEDVRHEEIEIDGDGTTDGTVRR
jgi:stress response protein YsnF